MSQTNTMKNLMLKTQDISSILNDEEANDKSTKFVFVMEVAVEVGGKASINSYDKPNKEKNLINRHDSQHHIELHQI